jgi:hypothetical protein
MTNFYNAKALKPLQMLAVFITALTLCSNKGYALGAKYTWTNGAGTRVFSTAGNWSPNRVGPNNFDTLIFNNYNDTVFFNALNQNGYINILGTSKTVFVSTVTGGSASSPNCGLTQLDIDPGAKLTIAGTNAFYLAHILGSYGGFIQGELQLNCVSPSDPQPTCQFNTSNVGIGYRQEFMPGSIFRTTGGGSQHSSFVSGGVYYTRFNDGATWIHERDGGLVTLATWAPNSTLKITGIKTATTSPISNFYTYGNIEWNCPNQSSVIPQLFGGLTTTVAGNFNIVNTGTGKIGLMTGIASSGGSKPPVLVVNGDFTLNDDITMGTASPGSIVMYAKVKGNFIQTGGAFDMSPNGGKGVLQVAKNFTQSAGVINESGTSQTSGIEFNGTTLQTASAVSIVDSLDIEINNPANVSLASNAIVFDSLIFTSGKVLLNNFNLGVGSVYNADNTKYVVTNGTGSLALASTGSVVFPIGPNTTSYNPLTITGGGAVPVLYNALVTTPIFPALATTAALNAAINRQWAIGIVSGTPTSNPDVTFQYNDGDAGSNCTPANNMDIATYNPFNWALLQGNKTPVGSGPRTVTATGVSTLSATPKSFVLGNVGFLTATAVNNIDRDINGFRLLPNVVTSNTQLEIVSNRADVMKIRVTDMSGRVVNTITTRISAGKNLVNMNCANFSLGVYHVTGITSKGVTQSVKLIRQ